jgi:predicted AlkP superfamily phosphohydrolase/phosphomutase
MKTLLVGIDGACRRVLDPLLADDRLPTLAGVFEDGVVLTRRD